MKTSDTFKRVIKGYLDKRANPKTGEVHYPSKGRYWVFNENEVQKRIADGRIIFGKTGVSKPVQRVFLKDREVRRMAVESWWDKHGLNEDGTVDPYKLTCVMKGNGNSVVPNAKEWFKAEKSAIQPA